MTGLLSVGLSLGIFLCLWVGLLDTVGVEEHLEHMYLLAASHNSQKAMPRDIVTLYIDGKEKLAGKPKLGNFQDEAVRAAWRSDHAKLVRQLKAAQARLVAFDFTFPPPGDEYAAGNSEMAAAVHEAQQGNQPMPVIVGRDDLDSSVNQELQAAGVAEALVTIGAENEAVGRRQLGRVLLAQADGNDSRAGALERTSISLPLALAIAAEQNGKSHLNVRIDSDDGSVVLDDGASRRRIPTAISKCSPPECTPALGFEWRRYATLPLVVADIAHTLTEYSYSKVLTHAYPDDIFKNKIVIVGARVPEDNRTIALSVISDKGPPIYGYQVVASVVADLIHRTFPRYASPAWQLSIIWTLVICSYLVRRFWPGAAVKIPFLKLDWEIPLGLVLVICILLPAAVWLLRTQFLLFAVGYDVLALLLGYYVLGRGLKVAEEAPSH